MKNTDIEIEDEQSYISRMGTVRLFVRAMREYRVYGTPENRRHLIQKQWDARKLHNKLETKLTIKKDITKRNKI